MSEKMTQEELDEIIRLHEQWLKDETTGERAGIADKDIGGLVFENCCLDRAVFLRVNLSDCKFRNVNLTGGQFIETNLYNVTIFNVNFNCTYFKHVSMHDSYIKCSNFIDCDIYNVYIENSFFRKDIFNSIRFKNSCLHSVEMTYCRFKKIQFTNTILFNNFMHTIDFDDSAWLNDSCFVSSSLYTVTFNCNEYTPNIFLNCKTDGITITK